VQTVDDELRREVLRNYLDVVILRDVIGRYSISNTVALRALMRHITQKRGISRGTIVTWLDEEVFDNRIDIVPAWKWLLTEEKLFFEKVKIPPDKEMI